jgi:hypothetical protein
VYQDLIDFWKKQRKHPLPASEADIAYFEHKNGIRLPSEFRQYLLEAAGIGIDTDTFFFYGIDQLRLWADEKVSIRTHAHPSTDPRHFIIFGDYLQWCYAYVIRVAGPTELIGEVIHAGMSSDSTICKSFRAFIDLYLIDDPRLHKVNS